MASLGLLCLLKRKKTTLLALVVSLSLLLLSSNINYGAASPLLRHLQFQQPQQQAGGAVIGTGTTTSSTGFGSGSSTAQQQPINSVGSGVSSSSASLPAAGSSTSTTQQAGGSATTGGAFPPAAASSSTFPQQQQQQQPVSSSSSVATGPTKTIGGGGVTTGQQQALGATGFQSEQLLAEGGAGAAGEGGEKKEKEHPKTPFSSGKDFLNTVVFLLGFTIVLVAARPLGMFFPRYLKLPLITGYLFVGIACGPFVTSLLSKELVEMLSKYVNALALSFISFQAGQEIYLPELKPQLKGIAILLGSLFVVTMILVTTVLTLAADPFFYGDFSGPCKLAIALMFGSIAVLGSPATVMAIKIELDSNGPFTNLMLGATMTAEFVVLVAFSISRIVSSIYCAKLNIDAGGLMFTMSIVFANIIVGLIIGLIIIGIFLIPGPPGHGHHGHGEEGHDAAGAGEREKALAIEMEDGHHAGAGPTDKGTCSQRIFGSLAFKGFLWLFMGFVWFIGTELISETSIEHFGLVWDVKFEPLLVLMVASCLAGHYVKIRHDMHIILDAAAPYMFLPFFTMTGAALKLDQVLGAVPLMSLFVGLRMFAIFVSCYLAGRYLLRLPPHQYNNLWLTLTPQAGVALGLANEVKNLSEDPWAAEFAATIVAAVVINQIIGPVLCAMGLKKAGESAEARALRGAEDGDDGDHDEEEARDMVPGMQKKKGGAGGGKAGRDLSYFRVRNAVVIGQTDIAFEIALQLSLQGAKVTVPLLDEERQARWEKISDILREGGRARQISFTNDLVLHRTAGEREGEKREGERRGAVDKSTDVIVFTQDLQKTLEQCKILKSTLSLSSPRLIAVMEPSPAGVEALRELGVHVVQPSITLANITTRIAMVGEEDAFSLSTETSAADGFSLGSYFRASTASPYMRFSERRMSIGRNLIGFHGIHYGVVREALEDEDLLSLPPARVSMFGLGGDEGTQRASAAYKFRRQRSSLTGGGGERERGRDSYSLYRSPAMNGGRRSVRGVRQMAAPSPLPLTTKPRGGGSDQDREL